MTVLISKPAVNLREVLADLQNEEGLVGLQILAADTASDAVEALNLEEHTFVDFTSTGIDDNATSTAVTIDSTGKLGLGMSDPQAKLHIQEGSVTGTTYNSDDRITVEADGVSNINLITNTTDSSSLLFSDTTRAVGAIKYDHTNNFMSFDTSSSEVMRIDSSGNVGIGTTSPVYKLEIAEDTGNAQMALVSSNTGFSVINFGDQLDDNIGKLQYSHSDDSMQFRTNAVEAMRIDSSGNLLVAKTANTFANVGSVSFANGSITATRSGNFALALNRLSSDGDIAQFYKDTVQVGSIGNAGGANIAYFAGAATGIKILNPSTGVDTLAPSTATGANRDALMDLGVTTSRFKNLYLSGGVYLGGTGSANLLDDYEEGTWTPTFRNMGDTITVTTARYTKVGRIVHYELYMTIPVTSDGDAFEWTLPFVSSDAASGAFIAFSDKNSTYNHTVGPAISASYHRIRGKDGSSIAYSLYSDSILFVTGSYTAA